MELNECANLDNNLSQNNNEELVSESELLSNDVFENSNIPEW